VVRGFRGQRYPGNGYQISRALLQATSLSSDAKLLASELVGLHAVQDIPGDDDDFLEIELRFAAPHGMRVQAARAALEELERQRLFRVEYEGGAERLRIRFDYDALGELVGLPAVARRKSHNASTGPGIIKIGTAIVPGDDPPFEPFAIKGR